MLRLIKFLYERRILLVFLVLEIFAIILLRNSSPYYSASYFSSSNLIAGSLYEVNSKVKGYFKLSKTNQKLLEENALLKKRLYNQNSNFKYLKRSYKNNFEIIESMIVNNTINQNKNFTTIDVGSYEGVKVGMGVVGEEGIVGRVYAVNNNYATVTSLLHSEVITSVKVGKKGSLATMKWGAKDYRFMKIEYLPRHIEIEKGDSVFTSGFNSIYPEGIFLGVITEVHIEDDKSFHNITMKLATNFSQLKYTYVLLNKRKEEIEEITIDE